MASALGKTILRGGTVFLGPQSRELLPKILKSFLHTMFSRPRSTGLVAPPKKKRKVAPAIEEISFDFSAREDYLTGFHKRKVQRIKDAKEEAAKKDREEKLAARKIVRFPS